MVWAATVKLPPSSEPMAYTITFEPSGMVRSVSKTTGSVKPSGTIFTLYVSAGTSASAPAPFGTPPKRTPSLARMSTTGAAATWRAETRPLPAAISLMLLTNTLSVGAPPSSR